MRLLLLLSMVFSCCLTTLAQEQVVRKFSPGDYTAKVAGITKTRGEVVINLNRPPVTKERFGFRGTVDYDKVELGGLEMYVSFKDSESYATMTQPREYKWMRGSAKDQPFFIPFDCLDAKESLKKLETVRLSITLPQGGSATIKSLELVQW